MDTYLHALTANPWAAWLVAALAAAIFEVALPYFTFIFIAIACAAASASAVVAGVGAQIAIFAVVLILSLVLLRPRFVHGRGRRHIMHSRSEALVGLTGTVTEAIDPKTGQGRVLVDGHDWAARSRVPLAVASTVLVEGHDGIVLLVKEK